MVRFCQITFKTHGREDTNKKNRLLEGVAYFDNTTSMSC